MFEKMGLGAILTFNSTQAVAGMSRAGASFSKLTIQAGGLQASMARIRMGAMSVGRGLGGLALAAAPLGLAIGYGAKKAMDFQQAIADAAAVVRATPDDMKALSDEAIRLGIETKFTATDAAHAIELLGRAGFNTAETLKGVGGVMAMAAAEGMDMATAADIAATVIRGMGVPLEQTSHVADVLAEASARTNTNIRGLGEGFAYAAPAAHDLGLSLEETTTALGILANVGLKGSQSGTALEAMLRGLRGVTDRSAEAMAELGVNVRNSDGSLRPLSQVIADMSEALNKYSKQDQDYLLFRIMRTEGMRAFNALRSQGIPAFEALQAALEGSSELTDEFGNKVGSAALMAATKLDTFEGAITLLKSSLESMSIILFQGFLKPAAVGLNSLITDLNRLIYSVKLLNEGVAESEIEEKYGKGFLDTALGIRDGVQALKDSWASAKSMLSEFGEWLGMTFGETSNRNLAKWITLGIGSVAAAGAMAGGLRILTMVGGSLFSILSGVTSIVIGLGSALLSVAATIGSIIAPAIATLGQMITMMGVGPALAAVATSLSIVTASVIVLVNAFGGLRDMFNAFIGTAMPGFVSLGNVLMSIGSLVWSALSTAYQALSFLGQVLGAILSQFSWVGEAIGYIFSTIMSILEPIVSVVTSIGQGILSFIMPGLQLMWQILQPIVGIFSKIGEIVWNVLKVGFEIILIPVRAFFDLLGKIYNELKPSAEVTEAMSMLWDAIIEAVQAFGEAINTYVIKPLEIALGWVRDLKEAMRPGGLSNPDFWRNVARGGAPATVEVPATPSVDRAGGGPAAAAARGAAERAAQQTPPRPEDSNVTVDNRVTVENNTQANIDGRCVSRSVSRTQAEARDRAGMTDTPYQRTAAVVAYQTVAEEPVL